MSVSAAVNCLALAAMLALASLLALTLMRSPPDPLAATVESSLRVATQLERAAKRLRANEAALASAIDTVQADAARAVLARLDADIAHLRSLQQLRLLGAGTAAAALFFEPVQPCVQRCDLVCAAQADEHVVCLRSAQRCLQHCRATRNDYRSAFAAAELSLLPSTAPLVAPAPVDVALLSAVREHAARQVAGVPRLQRAAQVVVRLPRLVGAQSAQQQCPVEFELTTDLSARVDVALFAQDESSALCTDRQLCIALWPNASTSEQTNLVLATESWPSPCAAPVDDTAPRLRLPTWSSDVRVFDASAWGAPDLGAREGVFVNCDSCRDAGVLVELVKYLSLRSATACRCGGVDVSVVTVSSSFRASDAAFFLVFGTLHLFAAVASGAVPVVVPFAADQVAPLPERAVVSADDFASDDSLARFLVLAEHDRELWGSFQQWRNDDGKRRQVYALFRFAALSTPCRLALLAVSSVSSDPWRDEAWQAFCAP
jgi:hypothetical protein